MLVLILAAGSASAQVRIGYVDMQRVLDEAPQVAAGRERLDERFRERSQALRAMENRLDKLEERLYGSALGANRDELRRRVADLRRKVRETRDELAEDINIQLNRELSQVEAKIHEAIQQLGEKLGYDLILSSPVEYASERVDLTDEVLQRLRVMYRQNRGGSAP